MNTRLLIGAGIVILFGVGVIGIPLLLSAKKEAKLSEIPTPMLSISPDSYDFGSTPIDQPVQHDFKLQNQGQQQITILAITTSCSCTTAKTDKESLAPGESALLSVEFDPRVHDVSGFMERVIFIKTDDPEFPEIELPVTISVAERNDV